MAGLVHVQNARSTTARDTTEDVGDIGRDMHAVVGRAEEPRPAVVEYERGRAGIELRLQPRRGQIGKSLHQRVRGFGIVVEERLQMPVAERAPPFDEKPRQRERCARNRDQRACPPRLSYAARATAGRND